MKRSGCNGLFIGAESGSQRILRTLKKDISLPNETKQDLLKTLELMKLLKETNPKLLWSEPPNARTKILADLLSKIVEFQWFHNLWDIRIIPKLVRVLKNRQILWPVLGE